MTTTEMLAGKQDRDRLELALRRLGAKITGNAVLCPFHNEKHPSGSIYERSDGSGWAYHCHGCGWDGDVFDVERAGGFMGTPAQSRRERGYTLTELTEMFLAQGKEPTYYIYNHPRSRQPIMMVVRLEDYNGKTFKQMRAGERVWDAKSEQMEQSWVFGAPPKPWPLYWPMKPEDGDSVIVVEGEKAATALLNFVEKGIVPVTSPGGAGKAKYADWASLRNRKVYLWPDKDDPGKRHMQEVAEILLSIGCKEIYTIEPPECLPHKGDAYDFVNEFYGVNSPKAIGEILKNAKPVSRINSLRERVKAIVSGERKAVSLPWQTISDGAKALWPGSVTILCGGPGSGKSFFLMDAYRYWLDIGETACIYEMEEDVDYHLYRLFAQITGMPNLLDDEWCRSKSDIVLTSFDNYSEVLEDYRKHLYASSGLVELKDVAKWIEERAKQKYRIICVDPVTVASRSSEPWRDDLEFVVQVKQIAVNYQCSIVLVSHPRLGAKKRDLDSVAGGAAYQRLSQTVFVLSKEEKAGKQVDVMGDVEWEVQTAPITHRLYIAKARNGHGQGLTVGMDFHKLTFSEVGVLV